MIWLRWLEVVHLSCPRSLYTGSQKHRFHLETAHQTLSVNSQWYGSPCTSSYIHSLVHNGHSIINSSMWPLINYLTCRAQSLTSSCSIGLSVPTLTPINHPNLRQRGWILVVMVVVVVCLCVCVYVCVSGCDVQSLTQSRTHQLN